MFRVDFEQIINYQQQYNNKHLNRTKAEIILEDLSCSKCYSKNLNLILAFKEF